MKKKKIERIFGVTWKDLADPNCEPEQAVKVTIYMPQAIADIERATIEGIINLIENYKHRPLH